ncbi:D-lyxose/D-mannose family sugar isomerase [Rhodovulum kholense]|uniref:D-lyxose ketol-isomerase n=1 Tax=Rhodovulum kholense TaxID=453584 RepID=A0A8E2VHD4_9RHOB|nr:D-lyxose/D-mannose family sugar isomerase [Rhodovulum kholense]PTW45228.1 hypothetical protein C8N38_11440 [Rhodovulum kholense]
MKRSDINAILADSQAFIRSFGLPLPPFADWSPDRIAAPEAAEIRSRGLGWDITDYGQGRFATLGLVLFTARNGRAEDLARGRGMVYAEKIMISRVGQLSPMHRHRLKTEDIINRGGGTLVLQLYAADAEGGIDRAADPRVMSDGIAQDLPPGGLLRLAPGSSVTLTPDIWHAFWAEGDDVLLAEVSTVNDDRTDNVFADPIGRFPDIEEDVPATRLLVSDYA